MKDSEMRIEGWAFDGSAGRPAASVELVVDGVPHPASYGIELPDDPAFARCAGPKRIGVLADYSVAGLAPGPHVLGVRVVAADGAGYTEATWGRITVGN